MRRLKLFALAIALFWHQILFAESHHILACEGMFHGENVLTERHSFQLDVYIGDKYKFYGPALLSASGQYIQRCMNRDMKRKERCEMSDSEITCSCKGDFGVRHRIATFNRYLGTLEVVADFNGNLWLGNYQCKKAKKMF